MLRVYTVIHLQNDKPMAIEMMPPDKGGSFAFEEEQPSFDGGLGFDNPLYDSVVQVCHELLLFTNAVQIYIPKM